MIGTTLGSYRLDAELGAGGMGRVYRATVTGRAPGLAEGATVAVKVVHPHLLEAPGFFKRFLREAELGRSIAHANVVRTHDCDQVVADGRTHSLLVMEYVDGQTLRSLLAELSRVPEALCRHVGAEVARGLAAIHAAGVVHRDVKPENLLVTTGHVVKVMDLGVARLAEEALRLSQSGMFVGSVHYAAPEQFRGGKVGPAADLHALGVVLYELATGVHPYHADDFRGAACRVMNERPRRPGEIHPQLSPFFEEVILRLLEKEPAARFGSAAELAATLDAGDQSEWWRERARALRAETRRPIRRIRIPRETAIHGRDAELAQLRALYESARAGNGRVVLVEGEAGIGKSRLVDEFAGLLQRDGEDVNFLHGSYPPGGAATASGAFTTAYREQFGDGGAAEHLKRTPALVPAFDALLRGEPTPSGSEPLTKDSLQTCFVHATRSLAAERPTIVLIDDLHFAPEEGRALFAALALAIPGHRALLIGTSRPSADERWRAEIERLGALRIPLARLGAKDLVRLLGDSLRSERLAEELAGRIAVKSDGNPFFVFEILRGLREGSFLTRREDGTWATTKVIDEIRIPSSVLELVQARISDLAAEDRDLLELAACCGFQFDPLLVAAAAKADRTSVLKRLGRIEKSHRLVRAAGRTFVFDHHQVQESLYGGLSDLLREDYHLAIAEALEARCGGASAAGAAAVELCDHFLRGGQGVRCRPHLDAAVAHLEAAFANDATQDLVGRALDVPELVEPAQRAAMLNRRAVALGRLGRRSAQREALDQQLEAARAAGDAYATSGALRQIGAYHTVAGEFADGIAVTEESVRMARAAADPRSEAMSVGDLAGALWRAGRLAEARKHAEAAVRGARSAGLARVEGNSLIALGNIDADEGRIDEAREHYRRAAELLESEGGRYASVCARMNCGNLETRAGDFAAAAELMERAAEDAAHAGDRYWTGFLLGNLGVVHEHAGRLGRALECWEDAERIAREIGNPLLRRLWLTNLAGLLGVLGDAAGVNRLLDELDRIPVAAVEGADLTHGTALAAAGENARAEKCLRVALESARSHGARTFEADALLALAGLCIRMGRKDEARRFAEDAARVVGAASRPASFVLLRCYEAVLGGDARIAESAFGEHDSRLTSIDRVTSRWLLHGATGSREHLAAAKSELDRLVAGVPPERRAAMIENVPLHRDIAAAAKAAGL